LFLKAKPDFIINDVKEVNPNFQVGDSCEQLFFSEHPKVPDKPQLLRCDKTQGLFDIGDKAICVIYVAHDSSGDNSFRVGEDIFNNVSAEIMLFYDRAIEAGITSFSVPRSLAGLEFALLATRGKTRLIVSNPAMKNYDPNADIKAVQVRSAGMYQETAPIIARYADSNTRLYAVNNVSDVDSAVLGSMAGIADAAEVALA